MNIALLSFLFLILVVLAICDIKAFDTALDRRYKGTDLPADWLRSYWWAHLPGGGIVLSLMS